jgi:hypothetical protein
MKVLHGDKILLIRGNWNGSLNKETGLGSMYPERSGFSSSIKFSD